MQTRWALALLAFGIGAVLHACSTSEFSVGGPLNVEISTNSPVSVGDSLRLDYDVQGRSLLGMVVTWGDSGIDSVGFLGAQSAQGHVAHVYPDQGSFTVMAEVVDQVDGTETRQVTVTVNP